MDLFEQASRQQLRWGTSRGLVGVEELWQMPLKDEKTKTHFSLNDIAKGLNKDIKENEEESFVEEETKNDETQELKFSIVKHIIKVRIAENKAKVNETLIKEKKQQILRLIADKKNTELADKSIEELSKMFDAL